MSRDIGRRFVVDASIARAAGPISQHSTSASCRHFLLDLQLRRYSAAAGPVLRAEWDRHQSNFSKQWRANMMSRKKWLMLDNGTTTLDAEAICLTVEHQSQQEAMRKDVHLIADAINAGDGVVASLDDTVARLFRQSAQYIGKIRLVEWINPASDQEKTRAWLEEGAPTIADNQLAPIEKPQKARKAR